MRGSIRGSAVTRPWRGNRALVSGALVAALVVLAGLVSLLYTPHDPEAVEIQLRLKAPGSGFALGTDQFGRDVLSRLGVGASVALIVAGVATALSVAVGVPLGAAAGYLGGYVDEVVMRAMDGLLAFPALLLAIAVVAALGPGHWHAAIAIGVVGIPVFARLTRGVVIAIASREFVSAVRAQGATSFYILLRHVMPNVMAPITVQASLGVGRAILAEAGLSYLGLGTQPPIASWGKMLQEAQGFMGQAPWMAIFPGVAIALTVLAFNMLGDGLRDLLDPRLR
jgi:peptide/nickel transport system permease protein